MYSVKDIRSTFLGHFEKNGHKIVPSSSLVPDNDPTLMFTNAGMNQFKNIFTGNETRDYKRATTSQKCVRAGGKHNDLDNVGYTVRHHTFFEMLGNFSFGDYFKEDAIKFAWDLLTNVLNMPKEKLVVTVYHTDDEAYNIWKKIGVPTDKIIRIATKDNFWQMGDVGPCGPCSEIFYDHGEHIWGGLPGTPEEDGDRFIEIWNLVFMQYEDLPDGSRINLPKPSIDTGMGLERFAAILQGKHSNYEIDLMRNLVESVANELSTDPDGKFQASHNVIADHIRSMSFLLADGVMPSNEGRGYVLRRIMRRAMRHAHMLGSRDLLLHKLVPTLQSEMGEAYPELIRADALIKETLKSEETRFKKLLDRGMKLLDAETTYMKSGDELEGKTAFKLYDTYGFPLDLTQDALREKEMTVDVDGFNSAMEKQKEEARKAWSGSGDAGTEKLWFEIQDEFGTTEFLGYDKLSAQGVVKALVVDSKRVDSVKEGEFMLVTNQTTFYGESGGQAGDNGKILCGDTEILVTDVKKKLDGVFVHICQVAENSEVKVGDVIDLIVCEKNRKATAANHSVTHILHKVLRDELGEHVTQKGSYVESNGMRFDISHNKQVTSEELARVEEKVNAAIRENLNVITKIMSPEDAVEEGAMALFGEKYGDEVRVVTMGEAEDKFSVELCGGTHVKRTGDIGYFKITSESALAAGIRRLECVTGLSAENYANEMITKVHGLASKVKTSIADLDNRIKTLLADKKAMENEISELRRKLASGGASASDDVIEVNGVKFVGKALTDIPAKELKPLVDELKSNIGSGVVVVAANNDGKASVVVGVTNDLTEKFNAVDMVRAASAVVGGKGGGGRPDMAQAGGAEGEKIADALTAVKEMM